MSVQKKSNLAYYCCQFLGFAFLIGISILGLINEPDFQEPEFKSTIYAQITKAVLSYLAYALTTHFFLRVYHNNNQLSGVRAYVKVILLCSLISLSVDYLLESFLALPLPDIFMYQHGIAVQLAFHFTYSVAFFMLWSLLYLTITSIRDRRKLAEQLKEQQLASLMNQINPHFLFNSLNTIRGMIFEDEDKAAELVTQLSTLFRYNLSTDTKAYTSLGKELSVCQHYLAIEDIRLGDRLRIEMNNSAESLQAKIPTMGLLTIVENSIKHGIANLKSGGILTLNSEVKNGMVIIDVINPYQADLVKSGTKVGLKNLTQRIELIFGSQAKLTQKTDNEHFHVTMILPYEPIQNG